MTSKVLHEPTLCTTPWQHTIIEHTITAQRAGL